MIIDRKSIDAAKRLAPYTNLDWAKRAEAARKRRGIPK